MKRDTAVRWSLGVAVLAAGLAVDFLTKRIAEQNLPLGEVRHVLPFLSLQRTANAGVAFGLFQGRIGAILMATAVAVVVMFVYLKMEQRPVLAGFAGGLLMAGTLGNAIDRIRQGYVTDFLKFPAWPNFNVADIWLVIGTGLLILGLLLSFMAAERAERAERVDKQRREAQAGSGQSPGAAGRAGEAGKAGTDSAGRVDRSAKSVRTRPRVKGSNAGGDA